MIFFLFLATVIMTQIHFGDVQDYHLDPGFFKQVNKQRSIQTNIQAVINITVAD